MYRKIVQTYFEEHMFEIVELAKTRNHAKFPLTSFWNYLSYNLSNEWSEKFRNDDETYETDLFYLNVKGTGETIEISEGIYKGIWSTDIDIILKDENPH